MDRRTRRAAAALAQRTSPDLATGLATGIVLEVPAAGYVVVNVGGAESRVRTARDYVPYRGDTVTLLRQGMDVVAIGSPTVRDLPDQALVASSPTADLTISVEWEGKAWVLPYALAVAPAVGQLVALTWTRSGGYVAAVLSSRLTPLDTTAGKLPVASLPAASSGQTAVLASAAYGWTGGEWTRPGAPLAQAGADVRASAWFYGGEVAALGDDRTFDAMTFTLLTDESAGPVTLHRHEFGVRPNGLPAAAGGGITVRPTPGIPLEVPLPAEWVAAFAARPCGIRTGEGGGATLITGQNVSALSGALTITWSR